MLRALRLSRRPRTWLLQQVGFAWLSLACAEDTVGRDVLESRQRHWGGAE